MSDLSDKLGDILSDPGMMSQIQGLASMLGEGSPGVHKEEPPKPKDLFSGISPETLSMMTKLSPLLSGFSKEDETTRLLSALRPFLSPERRKKLDEAEKLLKMMRILPLLKDFSLFG